MGKYVGNIPELSFLYILFDRVQWFFCCNLEIETLMKVDVGVCIYELFIYKCIILPVLKDTPKASASGKC